MGLISSVSCPLFVFFSSMVTTKLFSSRMSWSDQGTKAGGQTVAVGPAVGGKVAVGASTAVASTEGIRVGPTDADAETVGSGVMVWMVAGLHAWSSKTHNKDRTKRDALANMIEKLYMLRS